MPWVLEPSQIEHTINDIEKKLYACGMDKAVAILKHGFSDTREMAYVPDEEFVNLQKCDLCILSHGGMVFDPRSISRN